MRKIQPRRQIDPYFGRNASGKEVEDSIRKALMKKLKKKGTQQAGIKNRI